MSNVTHSVCVTTSNRSDWKASQQRGLRAPFFVCFLLLGVALSACAPHLTQPPDITLHEVHRGGAQRLAFAPSGRRLASGGHDGSLRVWSVEEGAAIMTLAAHAAPIQGLDWLDETRLVSADRAGLVVIWDLRTSRVLHARQLDGVEHFALAGDRSWLLLMNNTRLTKLALPSLRSRAKVDMKSALLSVTVNPRSDRIAASDREGRVWLLNSNLNVINELPRPSRQAMDLRFTPDGGMLLAGGWLRLLVWDLHQQRLEERSTEHLGKVASVDISPDGRHWLSLGRTTDSNVRLIDAESNRVLRRFQPHQLCGWQVRFSPDGRHAASAAEDGSIHIYKLAAPYRPVMPYPEFDD
jgi:hypothetical protein